MAFQAQRKLSCCFGGCIFFIILSSSVSTFKIILSDANVKAVFVNIFGGIVRCDMIAEGIIGAVKEVGVKVPVVVRLEGNNADLGAKKLAESGLNIIAANDLTEAAKKVVAAAGGAK